MAIFTWKINIHPVRFVHSVTAIGPPRCLTTQGIYRRCPLSRRRPLFKWCPLSREYSDGNEKACSGKNTHAVCKNAVRPDDSKEVYD